MPRLNRPMMSGDSEDYSHSNGQQRGSDWHSLIAQHRAETACRYETGSILCVPIHVDVRNFPIERRNYDNGALSYKNKRRFDVRVSTIGSDRSDAYKHSSPSIFLPENEIAAELIRGKAYQPRWTVFVSSRSHCNEGKLVACDRRVQKSTGDARLSAHIPSSGI